MLSQLHEVIKYFTCSIPGICSKVITSGQTGLLSSCRLEVSPHFSHVSVTTFEHMMFTHRSQSELGSQPDMSLKKNHFISEIMFQSNPHVHVQNWNRGARNWRIMGTFYYNFDTHLQFVLQLPKYGGMIN